jgi:hypothetical protein
MHLAINGLCEGSVTITDFYFVRATVGYTLGEENAFINAFVVAAQPTFLACLPSDWKLTNYKAELMSDLTKVPEYSTSGATPGTTGATHLPLEMAAVISTATLVKGQHGRGRVYMPAIPVGFVTPAADASRLNGGAAIVYGTFASAMVLPLTVGGSTYNWCVATRKTPWGNWTNAGLVINVYIRDVLATVRRRRPGRGI